MCQLVAQLPLSIHTCNRPKALATACQPSVLQALSTIAMEPSVTCSTINIQCGCRQILLDAVPEQKTEAGLILLAALTALSPQQGLEGDDQTADYQQYCERTLMLLMIAACFLSCLSIPAIGVLPNNRQRLNVLENQHACLDHPSQLLAVHAEPSHSAVSCGLVQLLCFGSSIRVASSVKSALPGDNT